MTLPAVGSSIRIKESVERCFGTGLLEGGLSAFSGEPGLLASGDDYPRTSSTGTERSSTVLERARSPAPNSRESP